MLTKIANFLRSYTFWIVVVNYIAVIGVVIAFVGMQRAVYYADFIMVLVAFFWFVVMRLSIWLSNRQKSKTERWR